jgi:hypothetical protein
MNRSPVHGKRPPEALGEQLALLLDGASARSRVLDADIFVTAAAIAVVLIDTAIPAGIGPNGAPTTSRSSAE